MQNLRDKLLQAGLVTNDQAEKAEKAEQQKPRPPQRPERFERGERHERRDARPAHERRDARPPHERRDARPPQRHDARPPHERPEKLEARIPKLPPLPGSREHQRLLSKKQVETDRQLRELVQQNQVAIEPGARTFYFVTRKGRLRRLELSDAQAGLLEEGKLAVVERPEPAQIEHSLVPAEIAEKLKALSEKAVRFLNAPGAKVGFLSDEELEAKKREEAALPPESEAGDAARQTGDEARGESAADVEGTPAEERPSAEVMVVIKRAEPKSGP